MPVEQNSKSEEKKAAMFQKHQIPSSKNTELFLKVLKACKKSSYSMDELEIELQENAAEIKRCVKDGILFGFLYEMHNRYYLADLGHELLNMQGDVIYSGAVLKKRIMELPFFRRLIGWAKEQGDEDGASIFELRKADLKQFMEMATDATEESDLDNLASAVLVWIKWVHLIESEGRDQVPEEAPKYILKTTSERGSKPRSSVTMADHATSGDDMPFEISVTSSADAGSGMATEPGETKKKKTRKKSEPGEKKVKAPKSKKKAEAPKEKKKYLSLYDIPHIDDLERFSKFIFAHKDENINLHSLEKLFDLNKNTIRGYYKDGTIMGFFEGAGLKQYLSSKGLKYFAATPEERKTFLQNELDSLKFFKIYSSMCKKLKQEGRAEQFKNMAEEILNADTLKILLERFCEYEENVDLSSHVANIEKLLESREKLKKNALDLTNPMVQQACLIESLTLTNPAKEFLRQQQVLNTDDLKKFNPQGFLSHPGVNLPVIMEISKVRGQIINRERGDLKSDKEK